MKKKRVKRKKGFFRRNYGQVFKFFLESRWHMVFALGIFCLTFLIGFIYPYFFRYEILSFLEEMVWAIEGKSAGYIVSFLFFNNLKASFFAMILGVGLGIFPIITLIANGYLLGFVSREVSTIEGISILWRLVPHGIFELPAVILSVGIGMRIGFQMFKGKEKIKKNLIESLRFFVFVVFPLLLIAAIIEGVLIFIGG